MAAEFLETESDGELIRRFAEGRDEQAFAALVERRGALVTGVCARMLRHREDAEDAFQAVFMVLARRAKSLRSASCVAGWLHEVAVRVCLNEHGARQRRRKRAAEAAEMAQGKASSDRLHELTLAIDEQLARLPERYRQVVVLCDLEGQERAVVARTLGVPQGTISSRLSRGREMLKKRLVRNGVAVAAGGVSFAFATCSAAATRVSAELAQSTTRNAQIFVTGTDAMKSTLGVKVSALANAALRGISIRQWKSAACLAAILATTLFGGAMAPSWTRALVNSAEASTVYYDDFNDGNIFDDAPVGWAAILPFNNGETDTSTGDLVLRATQSDPLDATLALYVPEHVLTRTSIQAQVRLTGERDRFGATLLARGSEITYGGYFGGVESDGTLYIAKSGAPTSPTGSDLAIAASTLTPLDEDVVVQFDLDGNSLSLYAWRPGQPKPAVPQLTATDASFTSGKTGVICDLPPQNGTATFRYVHVADTPIAGPSTGDTNFDGRVDLEDLNAVRNHFGEGVPGGPRVAGEAYPFDGVVDLEDLNLVRNHFGAGANGVTAPEPSTASLAGAFVGLMIGGLICSRRP